MSTTVIQSTLLWLLFSGEQTVLFVFTFEDCSNFCRENLLQVMSTSAFLWTQWSHRAGGTRKRDRS